MTSMRCGVCTVSLVVVLQWPGSALHARLSACRYPIVNTIVHASGGRVLLLCDCSLSAHAMQGITVLVLVLVWFCHAHEGQNEQCTLNFMHIFQTCNPARV